MLFSSPAGSWGNTGGNANIVPLVANGHVFVASNRQLTIFGLGGHPFVARAAAAAQPSALNTPKPPHEVTGVLEHVNGPVLTLRTRAGKIARVDDSEALRRKQIGVLVPGYAYTAQGTYDPTGAACAGRRASQGFARDLAAGSLTIKALRALATGPRCRATDPRTTEFVMALKFGSYQPATPIRA